MRIFGRPSSAAAEAPGAAPAKARDGGAPLPGPIVRTEAKPYKPPYINERKKYELIIAASGQVVYDYDLPSGDIVWSGHLEEVLGYEPQEMGGIVEWAERIHPDDRDEALRLLDIAEKDRTTYDVDYRFRHKNGSYRWFHDRGFFLIEDDRNLRRMLGMMQDGRLAFTLPMGDSKLPGIAAEDIGRCAYGIFAKGPAYVGKTVGIAGEHLTGAEMAAELGQALGQEVRYNAVTPEAYRAFGFPGAEDLGNMFQFKRDFADYFCGARDPAVARSLNPSLQTFRGRLAQNKERIPLE